MVKDKGKVIYYNQRIVIRVSTIIIVRFLSSYYDRVINRIRSLIY